MHEDIAIPDKPAFKAAEVCELLKVPPYVLKSWENEFRDLGVSKTPAGPRVYRREDVARALRIRDLVLTEGLTLAGVRRRLDAEAGPPSPEDQLIAEIAAASPAPARAEVVPAEWRHRLAAVRDGLRGLLDALSQPIEAGTPITVPAAPALDRGPSPGARVPARSSSAAARELVVEPEPAEPSLFDEGGEVAPSEDRPAARAGSRARRQAAARPDPS